METPLDRAITELGLDLSGTAAPAFIAGHNQIHRCTGVRSWHELTPRSTPLGLEVM